MATRKDMYKAIFQTDSNCFSFIFEKPHRELSADYFRDLEKLLGREKVDLYKSLSLFHNRLCESESDTEINNLREIATHYRRVHTGHIPLTSILPEFLPSQPEQSWRLIQMNMIVDFEGDLDYGIIELMSAEVYLSLEEFPRRGIWINARTILNITYAYLLFESRIRNKKIVCRDECLFFEIENYYLINLEKSKCAQQYTSRSASTCGSGSGKVTLFLPSVHMQKRNASYQVYVEPIFDPLFNSSSRDNPPTPSKGQAMKILVAEYVYEFCPPSAPGGKARLSTHISSQAFFCQTPVEFSGTSLKLNYGFALGDFYFISFKSLLLYGKGNISLKKFFIHLSNISFPEGKETTFFEKKAETSGHSIEIDTFYRMDIFDPSDLEFNFWVIPFCHNFDSPENCRSFFKEKQGSFKTKDVEGLHIRKTGQLTLHFEFENELTNSIYIHMVQHTNF